jgi:type IV fimbrial biogenesis protein FimT
MLSKRHSGRVARGPDRGFTMIELVVVLAIVAVSATLVAPSIARIIAGYQIRGVGEGILNGLNYARAEAVRRNTPVSFALTAGGAGWTVSQLSPSQTLQSRSSVDTKGITVASSTANTSVTFLATGLLQGGSQMAQVTVSSSVDATKTRRINIFGGGLIRMCDPAITTANDPRRC